MLTGANVCKLELGVRQKNSIKFAYYFTCFLFRLIMLSILVLYAFLLKSLNFNKLERSLQSACAQIHLSCVSTSATSHKRKHTIIMEHHAHINICEKNQYLNIIINAMRKLRSSRVCEQVGKRFFVRLRLSWSLILIFSL